MEERDHEDSEEFRGIAPDDLPFEDDLEAMEGFDDAPDEVQEKRPMTICNYRPPVDVDTPIGFFQRILKMLFGR